MATKKSPDIPSLIVVDIDPAAHPTLLRYGITEPKQWLPWAPESRNDSGWSYLLVEAGLTHTPAINVSPTRILPDGEPQCLEEFFESTLDALKAALGRATRHTTHTRFILLNLMPFTLCITLIDKIVNGILRSNARTAFSSECHLIFFLRNIDILFKSSAFQHACRTKGFGIIDVSAIDFRGYGATFVIGAPRRDFQVARRAFAGILPTTREKVHRSLVFETNTHLGHFILPNSHIRTHYDLSDFIARDNVWEYILSVLSHTVEEYSPILAVGTGLEKDAVVRMGQQLVTSIADQAIIDFAYCPDPPTVQAALQNWSQTYAIALVLSDIVNSGTTLSGVVEALRRHNFHERPIRVFTVARMQNSPQYIADLPLVAAVDIPREYYPPKAEECLLCGLQQPYKQVTSAQDFVHVDEAQLTPFDFWEIVHDASALQEGATDLQQRHFSFRVDTNRLIKRYGRWLENVIRDKAQRRWPSTRPDLLCTVEEESGMAFASLVSKALGGVPITAVPRENLRGATLAGHPFSDLVKRLSCHGTRVLLVDDGINYGKTLGRLIIVCRVAGAAIMGAIVFDCRLADTDVKSLCRQMGSAPLLSLYTWPSRSDRL